MGQLSMSSSEGQRENYKLLTLFAGAGGLDLGLELAGFEAVAASELEAFACSSLRANKVLPNLTPGEFDHWFSSQTAQRCYSAADEEKMISLKSRVRKSLGGFSFLKSAQILEGDLRSMSSKMLMDAARVKCGELTLVAGGPPCQPFSRAGKRQSVEVETGQLFREFVRTVSDLRPRWFLFENVKGLILTKTDVVFYHCKPCARKAAVAFDDRLMYLAGKLPYVRCDSCQSPDIILSVERKPGGSLDIILREFELIGYKCEHAILNAANFGSPQMRERLIIVGSRDNEKFSWPAPTHSNRLANTTLELFTEDNVRPWVSMREALWINGHPTYGVLGPEAVLWVKNVVRPHDEPVTWSLDRPSPTIGAHQSAKLAIAPFGVPVEQLARQQWHVLGRRQSDLPHVQVDHEYLSDQELLTLQTFPSFWYLHGTRMQRASQIGNAVPVSLAQAIGKVIMDASIGRIDSNCNIPAANVIGTSIGRNKQIEYATSVL